MEDLPKGYDNDPSDMFSYLVDSCLDDEDDEYNEDKSTTMSNILKEKEDEKDTRSERGSYVSGIRDLEVVYPTKTLQSVSLGLDFNNDYKKNRQINKEILKTERKPKQKKGILKKTDSTFIFEKNVINDRMTDKKLDTYCRFNEDLSLMGYETVKKDKETSFKNPYINDRFLINKNTKRDEIDYRRESRVDREFNQIPGFGVPLLSPQLRKESQSFKNARENIP